MKKALSTLAVSTLLASLVGCSSNDSASTNNEEGGAKGSSPNVSVVEGSKVKPLGAGQPTVYLKKGSATLNVAMKDASKNNALDVAVMPHSEESGTTSSIGVISGTGNFSKDTKFDVPKDGYYDITVAGDTFPDDFKGSWKASVEQKADKDQMHEKTLHVANFKEKIGGEFSSAQTPMDYEAIGPTGYAQVVMGFRALNKNSASIGTSVDKGDFAVSKSENGKWTNIEKSTNEMDNISKLYYNDTQVEELATLSTDKGPATICLSMGQYFLVYDDSAFKNIELTAQKKLLDFYEEVKPQALFWDSKASMIYAADNTSKGTVLYQYDAEKKEFVKDKNGKRLAKKLPFTEIGPKARYAKASDGTFYIANSLTNQDFDIEVAAFNKDFKLLAEPIKLTSIPNDMNRGDYTLAAYNNRLDIWSYYDSRTLNGTNYSDPLKVGLNKYTLTLQ